MNTKTNSKGKSNTKVPKTGQAHKKDKTESKMPSLPAAKAVSKSAEHSKFTRIGVIGLGIMGSAMANNLIKAGFDVCGFDPSEQALKAFKKVGGHTRADTQSVAKDAHVLITSLPNAAALTATAHALAVKSNKGLIVIETSTLDVEDKRKARDIMQGAGVILLDCPLSGTGAQAVRKDLTVYASGPSKIVDSLSTVFEGFSKAHFNLGEFGNGMNMKLMANLLVAIHNVSTAEALLLGERFGIPVSTSVKVLSDGAGGSRMLQIRGPLMEKEGWAKEITMKVEVWQKDMKLIAEALNRERVAAPIFNATIAVYNGAMGMGHEKNDTAAVFDVLQKMSSQGTHKSKSTKAVKKKK